MATFFRYLIRFLVVVFFVVVFFSQEVEAVVDHPSTLPFLALAVAVFLGVLLFIAVGRKPKAKPKRQPERPKTREKASPPIVSASTGRKDTPRPAVSDELAAYVMESRDARQSGQ